MKSNMPVNQVQLATMAKKKALGAYVYDMRRKLYNQLFESVIDSDRALFIAKLQETEDWLYKDGKDEPIGVYVAKLDELMKQGYFFEQRHWLRVIEENKAIFRDVLAYVDGMSDKLRDELSEFVTDSDRDKLFAKLQQTKSLLWSAREGTGTKREYLAQLDALKKLCDPIENRYKEYSEIRSSAGRLAKCIGSLKKAAHADPKYEHTGVKEKVLKECEAAESWLKAVCKLQKELPKHEELGVVSADISKREEELNRVCTQLSTDIASVDVPSTNATDVNMEDAPVYGVVDTGDNNVKMETDTKVESPKKKVMKSNMPVIEAAHVQQETKAKKNALEAFVYDMRDKLYDQLFESVMDSDRARFIAKLQETEDWLHKDGKDEPIGVYVAKLGELMKQGYFFEQRHSLRVIEENKAIFRDVLAYVDGMSDKLRDELSEFVTDSDRDKLFAKLQQTKSLLWSAREGTGTKREYLAQLDALKKLGDPIENRYKEYSEIRSSAGRLAKCIGSLKKAAHADPKYEHTGVKEKVLKECEAAESWLKAVCKLQKELPKHEELGVVSADISKREEELNRVCDVKMETDTKVESPKKVMKSNMPVIKDAHVQQAVQDCVIEETTAKKNALEAYIYDMRGKVYDKLFKFVKDSDRVQFIAKLEETEDWLYKDGKDEPIGVYVAKLDDLKKQGDLIEQCNSLHVIEETNAIFRDVLAYIDDMKKKLRDELSEFVTDSDRDKLSAKLRQTRDWLCRVGKNKTKHEYLAKLDALKKLGDPIENRYKEYSEIRSSAGRLANCIDSLKKDPKYERAGVKEKVLKECEAAENWLKLLFYLQEELPKHEELGVLSADIGRKEEELNRVCTQMLSTKVRSADVPSTNVSDENMEDAPEYGAVDTGDNAVKMEIGTKTMSRSPSNRARVLRVEVEDLINVSLTQSEVEVSDVIAYFTTVTGEALEKYGDDYECPNVMDICEKLREKNPSLFWERGTKDIAKGIMNNLRKSEMIQRVCFRGGCLICFKLSWEWMAKRIQLMIDDGIHTWAPMFSIKTAMIEVPTPARDSNMYADGIRSQYIRDTLARMLEYCGVDVRYRVSNRSFDEQSQREIEHKFSVEHGELKKRVRGQTDPTPLFLWRRERGTKKREYNNVCIDLGSLWSGVHVYQADFMIYITPARQRGYIEECINAARDVKWLDLVIARCSGYRTSYNEKEKLACLADEFRNYSKAASLAEIAKAIGYTCTPEAVFECALRYTYLKNHRLVDCTFSLEEMLDVKGNTFVYLLNTLALVYSSMKNSRREMCKLKKEAVAKERDLALHLVRFTDVVEKSCARVLPHLMCEYLWDLCKKFSSCYSEVPPLATRLLLCKATVIVMEKCFHLLKITPESFLDQQLLQRFLSSPDEATVNHFIPLPRSVVPPRLENSRFEMISMFVSLEDRGVAEGDMFGSITVCDAYGLHPDGWSILTRDDVGFVPYFERDWCNPMHIMDGSLIFFGNPSSRHAVAFASCIDIHACLMLTSLGTGNRKDGCYTICDSESKIDKKLEKFWQEEKQVQCDSICFRSNDGVLGIYYILIRDAIDVTMKMRYESTLTDRGSFNVRGYVHAYYDGVPNEVADTEQRCYKAVVFKTNRTRIRAGDTLDLSKSVVAVPANSRLIIDAFLQDVKSGEIIVDKRFSYRARPKASINCYMPECVPGTKGNFILTLNWSKGLGVNN